MIRQTVILEGAGGTAFTPLALALLVAGSLLLLLLPRRFAIAAFLVPVLSIPASQRLVLLGLDFTVFRIFILVGLVRIFASADRGAVAWWNPIDRAVFWYSLAKIITFTLLWMTMPAVINRLGYFFDDVGGYILCRCLIRDWSDVHRALKWLGVLCLIFAALMVYEYVTKQNPFWVLGSALHGRMRDGKVRAQGSFGHAILAGTFGATLFPIFYGYVIRRETWSRIFAIFGMGAACVMVVASTSSGPALTFLAAVGGLLLWPFRRQTGLVKWVVVLGLAGLHLAMNDPVWALLFRLRVIGGGSGYHRYQLVDQSIKHFSEWWLFGTKDNGSWGIDMWDLANHYIASGISGGLITLLLFLLILRRMFVALRELRARAEAIGDKVAEWRAWSFTNAAWAHAVAFFGISYWDQMKVVWVVFLAVVVAITSEQQVAVRASLRAKVNRRRTHAKANRLRTHAAVNRLRTRLCQSNMLSSPQPATKSAFSHEWWKA